MRDLSAYHRGLGAALAADGIPLHYGDALGEYQAAHNGAILLDRSHQGRILLDGDSRFDLVNRMSTNAMTGMAPFEGRPTVFTNANARILFRAACYNLPRGLLLISEPGQGPALRRHLERNIFFGDKATARDVSAEWAQFDLHGAKAGQVMGELDESLRELPPLHCTNIKLECGEATAARGKSIVGERWILLCRRDAAVGIHRALLRAGETFGLRPAGSLVYHALRVRSGRPAGLELSSEYLPLEVGLWDEISFSKGCYTGQEIIARMESRARLAKTIVHLDMSHFIEAPAVVYAGGRVCGRMTSSAQAPDGQVYALAALKTAFAKQGTKIEVGEDQGRRVEARVRSYAGAQPEFIHS